MLHLILAVVGGGLLLLLPGLTLLIWLLPDLKADWFERLALSAGVSLAAFPLLLLGFRTAGGLHWSRTAVWLGLLLCLALTGWQLLRRRQLIKESTLAPRGLGLAALLLVIFILFIRFWVIRDLRFPLWHDSVHHTMITHLLVDNGGLFDSWLPYLPLESFTYHFGFHSAVAFLFWQTGLDMPQAVLVMGQLLNLLAAVAIYPLALRITGSRWAGLLAVFAAALLCPIPGMFVNWGRYTQLAGQAILPVALSFSIDLALHPRLDWRRLLLGVISVAGLALTHYRVFVFYLAILAAWWLAFVLLDGERRAKILGITGKLAALNGLALVLIAPWLAQLVSSQLARQQMYIASVGSKSAFISRVYNQLGDFRVLLPTRFLGLAGLGLVISLFRRWRLALFSALWVLFLLLIANPQWLRLPGTGVVNNYTVLLSLYIPAAILVGYAIASLVDLASRICRRAPFLAVLVLVAAAGYGAYIHLGMLDRNRVMVTPADEDALVWIQENTPADARFLVNDVLVFGDSWVAGSDAGYWLPLLTGREVTVLPLAYTSETPISPEYAARVKSLAVDIRETGLSSDEGLDLLRSHGVTHVFVGARQGQVQDPPGPVLLDAALLMDSPHFQPVYQQQGVWVFEIKEDLP